MIPTETELCTDMKIGRTVIREALRLLEEDRLIRVRRGVGRFVSDTLPRIGIEGKVWMDSLRWATISSLSSMQVKPWAEVGLDTPSTTGTALLVRTRYPNCDEEQRGSTSGDTNDQYLSND